MLKVCGSLLLASTLLLADLHITEKFEGGKHKVSYIKNNKIAKVENNRVIITDLNSGELLFSDNTQKIYTTVKIATLLEKMKKDYAAMPDDYRDYIEKSIERMKKKKIEVKSKGSTSVAKLKATQHDIYENGKLTLSLYVSKELYEKYKANVDVKKLRSINDEYKKYSVNAGDPLDEAQAELEKGAMVARSVFYNGFNDGTEQIIENAVLSLNEDKIPDHVFTIPADFKKLAYQEYLKKTSFH